MKLKCEKCNSSNVYTRFKTKEIICRRCGHVTVKKNINEEEESD